MNVLNQNQWLNFQKIYFYDHLVIGYAVKWATCMEAELRRRKQKPKKIHLIAEKASRQAGVATFAFARAVFILKTFWVHGKELEVWYRKNQINE